MTRTETIDKIKTTLDELSDERLADLAQLAAAWTKPSVYSTLSESQKSEIDTAVDEADRGEVVPWDSVSAALEAKLKIAGV